MIDGPRSRAVTLYLLGAGLPYPKRSPGSVRDAFEPAEAERLLAYAESVIEEMNDFQPDWTTQDLQAAARTYRLHVHTHHPELDESALDALTQAFTFWWR